MPISDRRLSDVWTNRLKNSSRERLSSAISLYCCDNMASCRVVRVWRALIWAVNDVFSVFICNNFCSNSLLADVRLIRWSLDSLRRANATWYAPRSSALSFSAWSNFSWRSGGSYFSGFGGIFLEVAARRDSNEIRSSRSDSNSVLALFNCDWRRSFVDASSEFDVFIWANLSLLSRLYS